MKKFSMVVFFGFAFLIMVVTPAFADDTGNAPVLTLTAASESSTLALSPASTFTPSSGAAIVSNIGGTFGHSVATFTTPTGQTITIPSDFRGTITPTGQLIPAETVPPPTRELPQNVIPVKPEIMSGPVPVPVTPPSGVPSAAMNIPVQATMVTTSSVQMVAQAMNIEGLQSASSAVRNLDGAIQFK